MNEFKTCSKCFNSEELVKKLKELDPNAKVMIACQSMCAIGSKMPFVIANGILVTAPTVEEIIERVKEMI